MMAAAQVGDILYDAMLTTVSTHRVGNRPGRQEPRLKKRRPVWRELMMKPRNEYHRRLNSEAAGQLAFLRSSATVPQPAARQAAGSQFLGDQPSRTR